MAERKTPAPERPAPLATPGLRNLSQGISLAAVSMLAVFLLAMLSSLMPARLTEPSWQLAMVAALVDNAVIPLVALLSLHVAGRLNQHDTFSAGLRDGAARWACLAALGFLLLAPLQLWNGVRLQQADARAFNSQRSQAEQRFQQLRAAVAEAGSTAELQSRLRMLVGPGLERLDPAAPLPQVKQQLERILSRNRSQVERQIARERQQRANARGGGGLLPAPLRASLSCLAYALAFASLARLPGTNISLLARLLLGRGVPGGAQDPGDLQALGAPPPDTEDQP